MIKDNIDVEKFYWLLPVELIMTEASLSARELWDFLNAAADQRFWILIAVAITLLAFLMSAMGQVFSTYRIKAKDSKLQDEVAKLLSGHREADLTEIDFEDITRLDDLRIAQIRYQRLARRSALTFNFLIAGQFIVGALLASSFVQATLTPKYTGVLGVLVLLSSAVQQRFRPDVLAAQAKSRLIKCNCIIRAIEDGVFRIRVADVTPNELLTLRNFATKGLDDLDRNELTGQDDYNTKRSEETIKKSNTIDIQRAEAASLGQQA